jgi:hypothetical protein
MAFQQKRGAFKTGTRGFFASIAIVEAIYAFGISHCRGKPDCWQAFFSSGHSCHLDCRWDCRTLPIEHIKETQNSDSSS